MIIALIDNNEQELEISSSLIENEIQKYTNILGSLIKSMILIY